MTTQEIIDKMKEVKRWLDYQQQSIDAEEKSNDELCIDDVGLFEATRIVDDILIQYKVETAPTIATNLAGPNHLVA